jgi:hypothetical protein
VITLGTVAHADFTAYGFPLYMLVVNLVLFTVAAFPLARVVRGREKLPPGLRTGRFRTGRHAAPHHLRAGAVPALR